MTDPRAQAVLDFWFSAEAEPRWFGPPVSAFDQEVTARFRATYVDVKVQRLSAWTSDPAECLALVLVLDQFPRHMFRGTAEAFETDAMALDAAREALERGHDQTFEMRKRWFFYVPFEHSETLEDQDISVALLRTLNHPSPSVMEAAERHRSTIGRFGRFPYRNAALGRVSTPEEERYLKEEPWP